MLGFFEELKNRSIEDRRVVAADTVAAAGYELQLCMGQQALERLRGEAVDRHRLLAGQQQRGNSEGSEQLFVQ